MEIRQINQLMASMGRFGIKKMSIKHDGEEITLEAEDRHCGYQQPMEIANPMSADFEKHRVLPAEKPSMHDVVPSNDCFVTAPMVGAFYRAPSPKDAPFVQIGDRVTKHSVVCLIEAMKVMNEVKAGVDGTVAEIMLEDGHVVEFGSSLIRITP